MKSNQTSPQGQNTGRHSAVSKKSAHQQKEDGSYEAARELLLAKVVPDEEEDSPSK